MPEENRKANDELRRFFAEPDYMPQEVLIVTIPTDVYRAITEDVPPQKDDRHVIASFNRRHGSDHGDVLFIERLRDDGLDDMAIAKVVKALEDICPACFDNDGGCVCWRDE